MTEKSREETCTFCASGMGCNYHTIEDLRKERDQLKVQLDLSLADRRDFVITTAFRISNLRNALIKIYKKEPVLVSRAEAADMACEFKMIASDALFEDGKQWSTGSHASQANDPTTNVSSK